MEISYQVSLPSLQRKTTALMAMIFVLGGFWITYEFIIQRSRLKRLVKLNITSPVYQQSLT